MPGDICPLCMNNARSWRALLSVLHMRASAGSASLTGASAASSFSKLRSVFPDRESGFGMMGAGRAMGGSGPPCIQERM